LDKAKKAFLARKANGTIPLTPVKTSIAPTSVKASKKTVEKVEVAVKEYASGKLLVIGTRGTGFAFCAPETMATDGTSVSPLEKLHAPPNYNPTGIDYHAIGQPTGLLWVDSLSWLSPRGKTFRALPLNKALELGLVRALKATISRDSGVSQNITVYAPIKFNPLSDKIPHALATKDLPSGRVECRLTSDKRNVGVKYKIVFAPLKTAKTEATAPTPKSAKTK
jgi:hypothetical protein